MSFCIVQVLWTLEIRFEIFNNNDKMHTGKLQMTQSMHGSEIWHATLLLTSVVVSKKTQLLSLFKA